MKRIIIIFVSCWSLIQAGSIGSNTAVSRFDSQVTLFNSVNVAAFSALIGGFYVNDATSTATWSSVFATSGQLDLNNGALYLGADLLTTDIVTLNSLGTIIGNNYSFEFAPTLTNVLAGCSVAFTTSVALAAPVNTGPHKDAWSFNDRFVTVSNSSQLNNYIYNGSTLGAPVTQALTNSLLGAHAWHPSALFLAINTAGAANGITVYSVNSGTGALTSVSSATTMPNQPRDFAWHPTGFYIAVVGSGFVRAYPVDSAGNLGTLVGAAGSGGVPANSCDWIPTGTYLVTGGDSGANNVRIYTLGGTPAAPTLSAPGATATAGGQVVSVAWNPIYTDVFAAGLNVAGEDVQLYRHNVGAGTITKFVVLNGPAVSSVDWNLDGTCLLVSTANTLSFYCYNDTAGSLTLCASYPLVSAGPSRYSPVNNYIAQVMSTATASLRIYNQSPRIGTFNNLELVLHNDLVLQNCRLTFGGNCTLLGNGYTIDFNGTGTIAVASGGVLNLKGVSLCGLQEGSIQMNSSTSQLVLEDVQLILDSNYSFTQGSFTILNEVSISGRNLQFNYTSPSISTISANSTLYLDEFLTFSYSPTTASKNLLQFTDATSGIVLHGATLAATFTGLTLTNGTLTAERHSYLSSSARVQGEGITFGNGSTATNMQISVAPAAVLEVTSGFVINNNV